MKSAIHKEKDILIPENAIPTNVNSEVEKDTSQLQFILRKLGSAALILLAITFLTFLGLYLAQQGRQGLPAPFFETFKQTLIQTFQYLFKHPDSYIWHKETIGAFELVSTFFVRTLGLLLTSLAIATFFGGLLGIIAAQIKRRNLAPIMVLISILGISVPSFLLGMFLWRINIYSMRIFDLSQAILPITGFGWDEHIIFPALVLAARPFAQIMQVTYVTMSEINKQEYMRVIKAKGASKRFMIYNHALKNAIIPILTTMGTSLRFSLASIPVVESFFLWEGIGIAILEAFELDMPFLITDLTVSLGAMFLMINLLLDFVYPIIDPRLRKDAQSETLKEKLPFKQKIQNFIQQISELFAILIDKVSGPVRKNKVSEETSISPISRLAEKRKVTDDKVPYANETRLIIRSGLRNLPLMIGLVMVIALAVLSIFGSDMVTANPYETHRIEKIDGVIMGPPFEPCDLFPWGSDSLGRDIQALLFHGARQTITMALLAMLARVALGFGLGIISGWYQDSWFDRLVHSTISVWAAFPVTIFAMILILGIGIQKGMSVFIITFCIIGWGEIAQYVRSQVIAEKPKLYVESATAVGARPFEILGRHITPHLLPTIFVMASLEMGSVLMLLGELGYLNIFMGGGFRVETLAGFYSFSDIPEWGSLLANVRNWWLSYPWMAWYPGAMFFGAILSFNLLGEGLRRFIEESKINLNRVINRYTVISASVLLVSGIFLFRSQTPLELYKDQAKLFDGKRAMTYVEELASPKYTGRETGTDGYRASAQYIADQMEAIGLFPGGNHETYFQEMYEPRFHLSSPPTFEILGEDGEVIQELEYRNDFVEYVGNGIPYEIGTGRIVGLAVDKHPHESPVYPQDYEAMDNVYIVRAEDLSEINIRYAGGLLIVDRDENTLEKRFLYPFGRDGQFPTLIISEEMADMLLATCGSSLDDLENKANELGAYEVWMTDRGTKVNYEFSGYWGDNDEKHITVIGYIPGTGANVQNKSGRSLDSQVIVVSAYFDGLGTGPDGTFYPSANDNASGVATMLEMARVMMEGDYEPKKTVVFIAWSGGNRWEGLEISNAMNAKQGFGMLEVEAIIELAGVGAGSGKGIALTQGSSFRLVTLYQDAASRINVPTTTRGRGPHFGFGQPWRGNRTAPSLYISWNGSDDTAFTEYDTLDKIDPEKLEKTGETTSLVLTVLSREIDY
jgi:ABC-type dipeptide/oligopeptide/nickel transport system permease subunit